MSYCPGVKLSYNPKKKAMEDRLFLCQPFSLVGHQRGTIEKKETTLECFVWTKIMMLYVRTQQSKWNSFGNFGFCSSEIEICIYYTDIIYKIRGPFSTVESNRTAIK